MSDFCQCNSAVMEIECNIRVYTDSSRTRHAVPFRFAGTAPCAESFGGAVDDLMADVVSKPNENCHKLFGKNLSAIHRDICLGLSKKVWQTLGLHAAKSRFDRELRTYQLRVEDSLFCDVKRSKFLEPLTCMVVASKCLQCGESRIGQKELDPVYVGRETLPPPIVCPPRPSEEHFKFFEKTAAYENVYVAPPVRTWTAKVAKVYQTRMVEMAQTLRVTPPVHTPSNFSLNVYWGYTQNLYVFRCMNNAPTVSAEILNRLQGDPDSVSIYSGGPSGMKLHCCCTLADGYRQLEKTVRCEPEELAYANAVATLMAKPWKETPFK